MRLVIAITGASGVIYGIRALEALKKLKVETHLILSEWGEKTIRIETDKTGDHVRSLATKVYEDTNMAAPVSSGSFRTDGMAIIPCSMRTLASVANGLDDTLVSRAASVCIKEGRKVVVVPREAPLSKIHLENMSKLAGIQNIVIMPAMPGFYHMPQTMDDLIDHVVGKVLDQFGIDHGLYRRWGERTAAGSSGNKMA
ncbi:MAG TPA: UbiX family flavin prenyltransferase [Nitrososphaera sp.]|nr:UbiX family flavin prenyltransferase [Nitrososphaera sp.]